MFSNIVILLFTVSMASYQVYAATNLESTPQIYIITNDLVVTATIASTVTSGTFTIKYGQSGSPVDIGTVTVVESDVDTYEAATGESLPSHVVVATSGSNTETDGKIKVTITLEADDDGKVLSFDYDDAEAEDASFTVELSCPAINPSDHQEVKSSTGTGCSETDYRKKSCQTVFGCAAGYYVAADVTLTCTNGAWDPDTLPTCTAITCTALAVTDATVTCSETNEYDSSCTVECDAGKSLSAGTSPVTCGDASPASSTGVWSDTTHTCTATACPEIPAPTNGASSCTSGTSAKGATCTLSCASGYSSTTGTATLTCQDSTNSVGEWSDATTPVCTALITVSASPATYFLGDDVTISAVILDDVPDGDYTISYGEDTVSTVTIASDNTLSEQAATPGVANVSVEVSGSTIKVKKTSLVEADDGKVVKFDHATGADNDKSFTLDISTTPCVKIPNPANGTSTCATTVTQVGSSCTITCNEGTKLNGSSPVKCEAGSGLTGKWSNTTDTYSCDAISGAGMIALNMMLALVLGTISFFTM